MNKNCSFQQKLSRFLFFFYSFFIIFHFSVYNFLLTISRKHQINFTNKTHFCIQIINGRAGKLRLAREGGKPASKYVPCPGCLRWMLFTHLHRHAQSCICSIDISALSVREARKMKLQLPRLSTQAQVVVGGLLDDAVGKAVRRDEVLIDYSNFLAESLLDAQDTLLIRGLRGRLRLLGRFMSHAKTLDPDASLKKLLVNTEFENVKNICQSVPVSSGTTGRTRMLIGFELKRVIARRISLEKTDLRGPERNKAITSLRGLDKLMRNDWSHSH